MLIARCSQKLYTGIQHSLHACRQRIVISIKFSHAVADHLCFILIGVHKNCTREITLKKMHVQAVKAPLLEYPLATEGSIYKHNLYRLGCG